MVDADYSASILATPRRVLGSCPRAAPTGRRDRSPTPSGAWGTPSVVLTSEHGPGRWAPSALPGYLQETAWVTPSVVLTSEHGPAWRTSAALAAYELGAAQ